jgi:hypothetical protein
MAAHALDILSDDRTLAQFKQRALARARQFDINAVLPLYETYYRKIVEAQPVA